jgi:adenosylcobyric acid synthase
MSGRAVMLQGTGSSVGKSLLCAALCRIFARRGLRVAPFKAQNMSNNAFVTVQGGEISRAQAVQAEAAGIAPTVEMNPVLLKPEGEAGSQVVLRGKRWGRLHSRDFLTRKPLLWDAVQASLESLLAQYDLVVIEGAGSPAEVNLRAGDIVNMRVAAAAEAPVFLVGDIDRGGVFASLVGTLELLQPDERERVKGFLVNRFRGDPDLLRPGLQFLEQRTGRPVVGVVHHLPEPGLAEEDAATLEPARPAGPADREPASGLTVAAIKLPHLANFDDLDPLREAGLRVDWIERPAQLRRPNLIVLPGSKNTAEDLAWLEQTGLGPALVELADRGTPVLGLCGGYQMLGEWLEDPFGIESSRPITPGLGLLPLRTVLRETKATAQVRGQLEAGRGLFGGAAGAAVAGYEIHLGETTGSSSPLLTLNGPAGPRPDGCSARSGWIAGTYLHGLLHNPPLVAALGASLAGRAELPAWVQPAGPAVDPYERLADHVERGLDFPLFTRLAGLDRLL